MRGRAAVVLGIVAAACGAGADDGDGAGPPIVVAVAATPCDRPLAREGVATVVGPDLVMTALHVVEGPLRDLEVDGRRGVVVGEDRRLDLALVAVDGLAPGGAPPVWGNTADTAGEARIAGPDASSDVAIDRTVRLTVVDHTDRSEVERRSHVLDRAVPAGTSGSPVVAGAIVLGVVTLAVPGTGESHAVASDEIEGFLARTAVGGEDGRDRVLAETC